MNPGIDYKQIDSLAERAAREITDAYWPTGMVPVDPYAIANQLDIVVKKVDLSEDIAGGIWARQGYPTVIFLNENDSTTRQRFTCAHELGHYYLRQKDDEFETLDYRDSMASKGDDPHEVFANKFAANLLMPQEKVLDLSKQEKTRSSIAKEFNVSLTALNHRLQNIGIPLE